jgi:hypothetical protein
MDNSTSMSPIFNKVCKGFPLIFWTDTPSQESDQNIAATVV